jgi:hypothetical protein
MINNLINPEDKFWSTNQDGKVSLNNFKFRRFLEIHDFFKNKPNENSSFNIIKKNGIFLEIQDETDVKDFVLDYVLNNNLGEDVYNLLTSKITTFKRDFLSQIESKKIDVLRDTQDTAYLFYKNGVVEVKKDSQELKDYANYGLSIWKDQIINRNYIESDHHDSEFRTFIWKISGENVDRYNTFQSVIGYLVHSYKSNGNNKAIILNDEMISDEPNGRSGKGLFWNALKHMKKVQSIDGKQFSFAGDFPYQSVKTDCQVLVFDDVKRNFLFENLFSVITEGIEITYKGKDTIKLPVEDSPKILITTNYTIKGTGGSHDARKFEVELSTFFNSGHTPIDFFKHYLFNDWDKLEWARFDCYIIECIKKYLNFGLMNYESISLPFKKFELEITKGLFEIIQTLKSNEWIVFDDFYNLYIQNVVKKWDAQTKNTVTRNLKKYIAFYKYKYEEIVNNGVKKFKIIRDAGTN